MENNATVIKRLYPDQVRHLTEKQYALLTEAEVKEFSDADLNRLRTVNNDLFCFLVGGQEERDRIRKKAYPPLPKVEPKPVESLDHHIRRIVSSVVLTKEERLAEYSALMRSVGKFVKDQALSRIKENEARLVAIEVFQREHLAKESARLENSALLQEIDKLRAEIQELKSSEPQNARRF